MLHTCDDFCPGYDPEAVTTITPHDPIRPKDYPTSEDLADEPWPVLPPYCVTCKHEMLTVGDLYNGREAHAENDLNLIGDD